MISKEFNNSSYEKSQLEIQNDQLRELERRMESLVSKVNDIDKTVSAPQTSTTPDIIPAMVNFADNSDFTFSDLDYNNATYANATNVLAQWYERLQTVTGAYTENTPTTESPEAIRRISGDPDLYWEANYGAIIMSGGFRIAGRLAAKYANPGNYMVVRASMLYRGGDPLVKTTKLKVSLFDNNTGAILRGTKPVLTATKTGGHSGGTVTRQYILEVVMPDGRMFYSDVSSFTSGQNQAINTVATSGIDANNYVSVSWSPIIGASRYRVYRKDSVSGVWYLAGTVTNGGTRINDFGGTGGGSWSIPSFDNTHLQYQQAVGYYDSIGDILVNDNEVKEFAVAIQVPTTFTPSGDQFVQLEFVKEDYSNTLTTDIDHEAMLIDKIGVSHTNGRWVPSARDMTLLPPTTGTPVPPPSGGGDAGNPPPGTGLDNCVEENMRVLVWSDNGQHYYMKAKEIVDGDRLVCWDGQKLAPSVVHQVIPGISRRNYVIHTEYAELTCSFSHRLIRNYNDFDAGTCVKNNQGRTLCYRNGEIYSDEIVSHEILDYTYRVITFNLSKGKRNYIAEGFFSHNLKLQDGPQF